MIRTVGELKALLRGVEDNTPLVIPRFSSWRCVYSEPTNAVVTQLVSPNADSLYSVAEHLLGKQVFLIN